MPLTPFQNAILKTLAATRSGNSYFAGGAVLNRDGPRFSRDFDIFHDKAEKLLEAVTYDQQALSAAGFAIDWKIRQPTMHRGLIKKGTDSFVLDWAIDRDFRFFPIQKDPEFGFILHPIDIATNKLLAAVGREEPRVPDCGPGNWPGIFAFLAR